MVLYLWMLYADDVLHDSFRVDGQLFFKIRGRNLSAVYGSGRSGRCVFRTSRFSVRDGSVDGTYGYLRIFRMLKGLAERIGKDQQIYDGGASDTDRGACGAQYAFAGSSKRDFFLSCSKH